MRVASLNLCTDSMLFELLEDTRIVSVTHLARDPRLSYHHARAAQVPINHGHAEEILLSAPDLVVTGAAGYAADLLERAGLPVLHLEEARDFEVYATNLRVLAERLERAEFADVLLGNLARVLESVNTPAAPVLTLLYQPNGYTPGEHAFSHAVMRHAGLHNAAADLGARAGGFVSLERLLTSGVDLLILDQPSHGAPSLAESGLRHPALRRLARQPQAPQTVHLPENLWTCAGSYSAQAVTRLHAIAESFH